MSNYNLYTSIPNRDGVVTPTEVRAAVQRSIPWAKPEFLDEICENINFEEMPVRELVVDDDPDKEERYSLEDVVRALEVSEYTNQAMTTGISSGVEIARAERMGYIREILASQLTRADWGKTIRRTFIRQSPEVMTSCRRRESDPDVVFIVVDGYIYELDANDTVFIDDSSAPATEVNND